MRTPTCLFWLREQAEEQDHWLRIADWLTSPPIPLTTATSPPIPYWLLLWRQTCNQTNKFRAISANSCYFYQKGANQTAQAGRIVRSPRSCWGSIPASHRANQTKEAPARPPETSHTARTCQCCHIRWSWIHPLKASHISQPSIGEGLPWWQKCIPYAGASVAASGSFCQDSMWFTLWTRCASPNLIRHHMTRWQLPEYRQNGKDETLTMVLASFLRHLILGGGFCFLFCHSWPGFEQNSFESKLNW